MHTHAKWVFGTHLKDDDTYLHSGPSKDFGEIKIQILSAIIREDVASSPNAKFAVGEVKVHERSKKAMAHQIKCVRFKFIQ